MVKNLLDNARTWETHVQSLGRENPLEKQVATHSSLENPMDRGAWVLKSWTHIPLFDGIPCTNLHIVCVE